VERRVGLHEHGPQGRVQLAQASHYARERSRSADACEEVRDPAPGLLPDFGRGSLVVRAPVRGVVVLVRVEILLRLFGGEPLRQSLRGVEALARVCLYQLRAVDSEYALALRAGVSGQAQADAVAARRADHRVGYPRVAARRVEDCLLRRERARALAFEDHRERRAVFHGAAGAQVLRLRVTLDAA